MPERTCGGSNHRIICGGGRPDSPAPFWRTGRAVRRTTTVDGASWWATTGGSTLIAEPPIGRRPDGHCPREAPRPRGTPSLVSVRDVIVPRRDPGSALPSCRRFRFPPRSNGRAHRADGRLLADRGLSRIIDGPSVWLQCFVRPVEPGVGAGLFGFRRRSSCISSVGPWPIPAAPGGRIKVAKENASSVMQQDVSLYLAQPQNEGAR